MLGIQKLKNRQNKLSDCFLLTSCVGNFLHCNICTGPEAELLALKWALSTSRMLLCRAQSAHRSIPVLIGRTVVDLEIFLLVLC